MRQIFSGLFTAAFFITMLAGRFGFRAIRITRSKTGLMEIAITRGRTGLCSTGHGWTSIARAGIPMLRARIANVLTKRAANYSISKAALTQGRYEKHHLDEAIDHIQRVVNSNSLDPRDRGALADDLRRMRDYREFRNHHGDRELEIRLPVKHCAGRGDGIPGGTE